MSKILVNVSGFDVDIADTGVTIPVATSYTIPPQDYPTFAASSDVIRLLSDPSLLTLNDGGNDITNLSNAIDIIKGWPIQTVPEEDAPFFFDYADIPVGAGPHVLMSDVVQAGTILELTRLYVSCRMESMLQLFHNGLVIATLRTGAAYPTASFDWRPNNACAEGDSIEIVLTKRSGAPDTDVGVHLMGISITT
jgi:hypothetical protein